MAALVRQVHGRCKAPGCTRRAVHLHHVVYEQEVARRGGDTKARENYLPLCFLCHGDHHGGNDKLPLRALPDEAIEWAFGLLGPYAYDYLQRKYEGRDSRLDDYLGRTAA